MDEKKTEVSINVSAPYDADSCEGVLAICSWIKEAVCKCGIEIKSEEYSFCSQEIKSLLQKRRLERLYIRMIENRDLLR